MAESWRHLAPQLRDLPTYLALLRSHELPTLIASALDARHDEIERDANELRALVDLLIAMVENKWNFQETITSDDQRLLDYAHDWASETLASLTHPAPLDTSASREEGGALDAMARELFVLRPHTTRDRLAVAETAMRQAVGTSAMDAASLSDLLETSVMHMHDDAQLLQWIEEVVGTQSVVAVGPVWRARIVGSKRRLLEQLSLHTRVAIWASDMSLWKQQLDAWLVEVHEAPFRSIETVICVPRDGDEEHVLFPSHLHVALVSWATRSSRRPWLRARRSRSLLSAVSRLVRHPEIGKSEAYGRRILANVPRVLLEKNIQDWTKPQRARVLQTVATNLLESTHANRWREFVGLVERPEILQCAIDTLLRDPLSKDWEYAATIVTWHESVTYDTIDTTAIDAAIRETANGLGGDATWRDAVAWLQQHRSSSFASCTLTRLRLAWRWLVHSCIMGTAATLSDALESIEYALRRFAPVDDARRFQIEVIVTFLEDLDWCFRDDVSNEVTAALETIVPWFQKLVHLLPTNTESASGDLTTLRQQLDERCSVWISIDST